MQLKFNWRLAQDCQLIRPCQFEHGIKLMEEVVWLLDAWLKAQRAKPTASAAAARATPAHENPSSAPPGPWSGVDCAPPLSGFRVLFSQGQHHPKPQEVVPVEGLRPGATRNARAAD